MGADNVFVELFATKLRPEPREDDAKYESENELRGVGGDRNDGGGADNECVAI